jgi:hypothetical protein
MASVHVLLTKMGRAAEESIAELVDSEGSMLVEEAGIASSFVATPGLD